MDATDLPLLGEPEAIELANTLYGSGADQIDFLGELPWAQLWLAHALKPSLAPSSVTVEELQDLRELRDSVVVLLDALRERRQPAVEGIATVNRHAAKGGAHAELVWSPGSPPSARVRFLGDPMARVLAALATSCIELCVSARPGTIRRCEGPGCSLLFVQHDRRRRFCHEGCSHRARQRKYARSRR